MNDVLYAVLKVNCWLLVEFRICLKYISHSWTLMDWKLSLGCHNIPWNICPYKSNPPRWVAIYLPVTDNINPIFIILWMVITSWNGKLILHFVLISFRSARLRCTLLESPLLRVFCDGRGGASSQWGRPGHLSSRWWSPVEDLSTCSSSGPFRSQYPLLWHGKGAVLCCSGMPWCSRAPRCRLRRCSAHLRSLVSTPSQMEKLYYHSQGTWVRSDAVFSQVSLSNSLIKQMDATRSIVAHQSMA